MSQSWLRRQRWPVARWTILALALSAIGWLLYTRLPPQPRWVVRGAIAPLGLAPDGKTFLTETRAPASLPNSAVSRQFPAHLVTGGPVQLWDVETGHVVRSLLAAAGPQWHVKLSEDGKRLAALGASPSPVQRELISIELATGRACHATVDAREHHWWIYFSPSGDLLLLDETADFGNIRLVRLFDADTLRPLAEPVPTPDGWKWTADGQALLAFSQAKNGHLTVRRIGRTEETRTVLHGASYVLEITPDGKTLITYAPEGGKDSNVLLLWDAATGKRRGTIPIGGLRIEDRVVLADSRTFAFVYSGSARGVAVWDLEGPQRLGEVTVDERQVQLHATLNAFIVNQPKGPDHLAMYRMRPFGKLWDRRWPGTELHSHDWLSRTGLMLAMPSSARRPRDRVELLDVETGATRRRLDFDSGAVCGWRDGGRCVAFDASHDAAPQPGPLWAMFEEHVLSALVKIQRRGPNSPGTATVFDIETGACLCRIDHTANHLSALSPDGQSLFLYEEARHDDDAALTCYDVPPRRYWALIIGMPATMGLLLFALGAGWGWLWRKRKAPAPAPGEKPALPSTSLSL